MFKYKVKSDNIVKFLNNHILNLFKNNNMWLLGKCFQLKEHKQTHTSAIK